MQLYGHFLWIHVLHSSKFISVDFQAIGKSYDCPSAIELSLKKICKCLIPNHNKTHYHMNSIHIFVTYFYEN